MHFWSTYYRLLVLVWYKRSVFFWQARNEVPCHERREFGNAIAKVREKWIGITWKERRKSDFFWHERSEVFTICTISEKCYILTRNVAKCSLLPRAKGIDLPWYERSEFRGPKGLSMKKVYGSLRVIAVVTSVAKCSLYAQAQRQKRGKE